MNQTLFESIGGLPTIKMVHKIFYDKVYAHEWLKQFFVGHNQESIENRQTSFMAEKMGSPTPYLGKDIRMVHEAMYITPELFDIRMKLLEESLKEANIDKILRSRWLRIDGAFKQKIIKDSIEAMYNNNWQFKKPIIISRPTEK